MTDCANIVGGDYEHTLGVGGVWRNIEIRYRTATLAPVFFKMLRERCYEVCEFSLANYLMLRDRGEDWLQALPIFPYRAFRHSTLHVRSKSILNSPADLANMRLGVPDFSMTAAVWTRGILSEHYGVDWRRIQWVVATPQRFSSLPEVQLDQIEGDLEQELLEGRIDALLTTRTKDQQAPAERRQLRALIPDVEEVERKYFASTGIYPINHVVVVRKDVLNRLPDLATALFEAYSDSKQRAYERRLGATLAPWASSHWRDVFDLFEGDPLPYGLVEQNKGTLLTFSRYLRQQGLIHNEMDPTTLFVGDLT